jgi:hypothetical protein
VPYEAARQVITGELGVPPEEPYASFSPRPRAVASLEQVHHAVLADGTQVAVKVQRPSLDRQVDDDLGAARLMGRYGERRSTRGLSVPFRPVDDRAFSRAFKHQMSGYDRGAGTDMKVVLSAAMVHLAAAGEPAAVRGAARLFRGRAVVCGGGRAVRLHPVGDDQPGPRAPGRETGAVRPAPQARAGPRHRADQRPGPRPGHRAAAAGTVHLRDLPAAQGRGHPAEPHLGRGSSPRRVSGGCCGTPGPRPESPRPPPAATRPGRPGWTAPGPGWMPSELVVGQRARIGPNQGEPLRWTSPVR